MVVVHCVQNKGRLLQSFARNGYVPYVEELVAAGAKAETTDWVKGRRGWMRGVENAPTITVVLH